MTTRGKTHIDRSQTFDDFLSQQGMLEDAEEQAIREIIADQIRDAMCSPSGRTHLAGET